MKSFIASLCVLITLFLLVIFNSIYIINVTNRLIDTVNGLSFNDINQTDNLKRLWENKKFSISLCSTHKETDKIEEAILMLEESTKGSDSSEFEKRKSLLINYIYQIQKHEKITLDNLL